MNFQETIDYIGGIDRNRGSVLGLERIEGLLEKLGNPQQQLHTVHVAGTNGKGSCCAMLSSVLKSAGYKTGVYTSPHLRKITERIQINGHPVEDEEFAAAVTRIRDIGEAMEQKPTQFEVLTAAALLIFTSAQCDIAVFEVGLGGRFDATNVLVKPEAEIIMKIGLDHTELLGDTLEKIAYEKAGIIKPDTDAVLFSQGENVENVVRNVCEERGARLTVTDFSQLEEGFVSLEGQTFRYRGNEYAIPLLGKHQTQNAAVVIDTVEVLRGRGYRIDQQALEHGLYSVYWPGRFEICQDDPYFVVDGGHNPQCAKTVVNNLATYFPDQKHILLVGVLRDKDYETMFKILNLAADEYYCITPDSSRALPAEELAEHLRRFGKPVTVCTSPGDGVYDAMERAKETGAMVCAVGSLYSLGDIREQLGLE